MKTKKFRATMVSAFFFLLHNLEIIQSIYFLPMFFKALSFANVHLSQTTRKFAPDKFSARVLPQLIISSQSLFFISRSDVNQQMWCYCEFKFLRFWLFSDVCSLKLKELSSTSI
ncbi:hypothetical protein HanHA89_Chr14g0566521 [Helianthus annuus]|nr:hypothetical protein HanHA89_Chr14g0566521 [Helianthus annuus]